MDGLWADWNNNIFLKKCAEAHKLDLPKALMDSFRGSVAILKLELIRIYPEVVLFSNCSSLL